MTYKLGSLFDGSGGFPLAGALCGVTPVWAAEVEPYPIAVTRSRFPDMRHLGDISKVSGADIEPVDVITFGSPCQDLSVAGKRAGLKHEVNGDDETTRSGLFMEAVRIIKEMREATNGEYPRFALWENVPGAFSSNKGEDFRIVLAELIRVVEPTAVMPAVPKAGWNYADDYRGDGWSLAYRVFDAQYWGVPQRRRRIHLVVDFRGECAREVLFEREGVRGYFEKGRTPWQGLALDAEEGSGAADSEGTSDGGSGGRQLDAVAFQRQMGGVETQLEVSPTLMAAAGMSGNNKPCVAYSFDSLASNSMKSSNPHSGCRQVEVAKTLDTTDPNPSKNQGGIAIVEAKPYTLKIRSGVAVDSAGKAAGKGALVQTDKAATLAASQDQYLFQPTPCIVDSIGGQAERGWEGETAPCLKASHYKCPPVITQAAGFCTEHSAKAGGVGYQEEIAPTLRAGVTPAVCFDARGNGDGETVNTLTGDHNNRVTDYSSVVVEPVVYAGASVTSPVNASNPQPGDPCHTLSTDSRNYAVICLQGNGIDRADTAGCNGKGWKEDVSYTLNTIDRPAVVYGLDRASFNQGANAKFDFTVTEESQPTLTARGPGAVAYTASKASFFTRAEEGLASTLVATDYKDPQVVAYGQDETQYIVRRLTPTECARLQGFADRWGDIDEKKSFTPEEYQFWLDVRNTHAAINGKAVKDYTESQMLTWYNKLHTDAAEYKMWGNGIALPPALYCLQGMVDALNAAEVDDSWML